MGVGQIRGQALDNGVGAIHLTLGYLAEEGIPVLDSVETMARVEIDWCHRFHASLRANYGKNCIGWDSLTWVRTVAFVDTPFQQPTGLCHYPDTQVRNNTTNGWPPKTPIHLWPRGP